MFTRRRVWAGLVKDVYTQGEVVSVTMTLRNEGTRVAERVTVDCGADAVEDGRVSFTELAAGDDWIDVDTSRLRAMSLSPGEPHTVHAQGTVSARAYNIGILAVMCVLRYAGSPRTVSAVADAAVTGATNVVTGRVTVCRSDDRMLSDTSAVGITIGLEGDRVRSAAVRSGSLLAVTDPVGRFDFPAVPAGPYVLTYRSTGLRGYGADTVDLLVTGDGVRWQTNLLAVTPTDPKASCGPLSG